MTLQKSRLDKWTMAAAVIAALASLLGVFIDWMAYESNHRESERNYKHELQKKQREDYGKLLDILGQIATYDPKSKAYENSVKEFKKMYVGRIVLYADNEVMEALVQLLKVVESRNPIDNEMHQLKIRKEVLTVSELCRLNTSELRYQITSEK